MTSVYLLLPPSLRRNNNSVLKNFTLDIHSTDISTKIENNIKVFRTINGKGNVFQNLGVDSEKINITGLLYNDDPKMLSVKLLKHTISYIAEQDLPIIMISGSFTGFIRIHSVDFKETAENLNAIGISLILSERFWRSQQVKALFSLGTSDNIIPYTISKIANGVFNL